MSLTDCRLHWQIYDPFLPGRDVEAAFYQEYPTVTQWKATVRPMNRGINFWEFSFSLELTWDISQEVVAEWLMVSISLNGTGIAGRQVHDRRFNVDNQFRYDFQTRASISPQTEPHCLDVVVEISLADGSGLSEEVEYQHYHENDLRCLSRNLGLLLNNPLYSDMTLIPDDFIKLPQVHSYIIGARWNKFFALHDFEEGIRASVETNISYAVLRDILTYMYSGTVGITWPDWNDPAYTTELFQVIDRFKLYHLYKVFVKDDMMQFRVTKNAGIIACHLFALRFTNDGILIDTKYSSIVEAGPEFGLIFSMYVYRTFPRHINPNRDNPFLAYSLLSLSSSRLYAKVNMELVMVMDNDPFVTFIFLEENFIIEPFATVSSQNDLILGNTEINYGNTQYFIRCYFNVTDGATVEQIRNTDDDTKLNESARLSVLSDHMHLLREQPVTGHKMRVLCRSEGHDERGQDVHKGIFAVRVPVWWQGLENVPPANGLPDTYMTPILSKDSLPIVLDYIYTGKMFKSPFPLLREVKEFAERTGFFSLLNSANRVGLPLTD